MTAPPPEDLTEPAAIVAELAACDEPMDSEYGDCVLCGGYGTRNRHRVECSWARAVEWVKRQRT